MPLAFHRPILTEFCETGRDSAVRHQCCLRSTSAEQTSEGLVMKRIRTILHPTDFSPGSDAAFQYACELAVDYNAGLIVLYVQGPVVPFATEGILISSNPVELREFAKTQLNAIRPANTAVRIERIYREGSAKTEILTAAAEFNADLVDMGTHGRSGIGRLLLGSVTEEVLRKAPCPVLTVKAQKPATNRTHVGNTANATWAGV